MEQNIFQVINENNLDEILSHHMRDLVVIMLSGKNCSPCKAIKPKFVELSKQYKDIFFVYVDITNYTTVGNKYFSEYEFTPTFLFYFGYSKIAFIEGAHEQSLVKTLLTLKQKIEEKKRILQLEILELQKQQQREQQEQQKQQKQQQKKNLEMLELQQQQEQQQQEQQQEQQEIISGLPIDDNTQVYENQLNDNSFQETCPVNNQSNYIQNTDLLEKKIDGLNKLRYLVKNGIKLSKPYDLNSDYEEILFEIRFQTDPSFKQYILEQTEQSVQLVQPIQPVQPVQPNNKSENSELLKKQEQVKQIKELNMLNQTMQMESFKKLQQLQRIKAIKEQQENNYINKKEL